MDKKTLVAFVVLSFATVIAFHVVMSVNGESDHVLGKNSSFQDGGQANASGVGNYIMTTAYTYSWIDATVGTRSTLSGDDAYQAVSLPFSFAFYGTNYSTLYICTNGFVSFAASSSYSNMDFPMSSPTLMIAPFWDDLRAESPSNIYYRSLTAPNRFVVEYLNYYSLGGTLVGTFEVVLFSNGDIVFNYDYVSSVTGQTVGLNYGIDTAYYNQYTGLFAGMNDFSIRFQTTSTPNTPPTLTSGSVSPSSGNQATTFTYTVTYTDADNNAPSYVRVYIDGSYHTMSKQNSGDITYTDGCVYVYSCTLALGSHNYYFYTSDGLTTASTSTIQAPTVRSNSIPVLSSDSVSPANGDANTQFLFSVTYTDPDNDAPYYIHVIIDGNEYSMYKRDNWDNTYTDGVVYEYKVMLPVGTHAYYFASSDSSSSYTVVTTTQRMMTVIQYSVTQVGTTTTLLLVFLVGIPLFLGIIGTKVYNKKKGLNVPASTTLYRRPAPPFQPSFSSPPRTPPALSLPPGPGASVGAGTGRGSTGGGFGGIVGAPSKPVPHAWQDCITPSITPVTSPGVSSSRPVTRPGTSPDRSSLHSIPAGTMSVPRQGAPSITSQAAASIEPANKEATGYTGVPPASVNPRQEPEPARFDRSSVQSPAPLPSSIPAIPPPPTVEPACPRDEAVQSPVTKLGGMENDNLHDSGAADSDRSIEDIERELIGMISAAAGSDLIAVPELVQGSSLDTNRDTTMGSNPDVITDAAPGAAPDVARGVDEHGLPEEPWVDRLERASEQLDETPGPGSSLNPTSRASTVPPTEYQDAQEKPDNHVPVTDAVPFEHGNLLHPSTADTTSTNTILQSIEVELLSLINRVERSRDEASPENDAISPGPKKPILQ